MDFTIKFIKFCDFEAYLYLAMIKYCLVGLIEDRSMKVNVINKRNNDYF